MQIVVLAEDDDAVRKMMRRLLEHWGYQVVEAVDGLDAKIACEAMPVIDLVVVDMQMPRLTGPGLVEALEARGQSPRVLVCSGAGAGIEGLPFLSKPFSPQDLRVAVEKVLLGPTLAEQRGR